MKTPEGRVKDDLKDSLRIDLAFPGFIDADSFYIHWPVLNGMGSPEVDCNILYKGQAYAIECKAPGKFPTQRQWDTLNAKRRAGAWCFIVGGVWGEYRGRPMARADRDDIELVSMFLMLRWNKDYQPARDAMHENWKKYGGVYG